jgi:hypothetical protein
MPLDLSKPVQTRDGRPVRILCTDLRGEFPVVAVIENRDFDGVGMWRLSGVNQFGQESDLVNVREPERTGWLNVYRDDDGGHYVGSRIRASREESLDSAYPHRIVACIEVKYRHGQGLET